MDVLIYGFKPYREFTSNVSEKLVKKLQKRKKLTKITLPATLQKGAYLKLTKHKPNVILGIGQCKRGKKIRIERKAANVKQPVEDGKIFPISKKGQSFRRVNLMLEKNGNSKLSYDAGKYACNFSMYVLSNVAQKDGIAFAFIHIPRDYNLSKAIDFVEQKIDEVMQLVSS